MEDADNDGGRLGLADWAPALLILHSKQPAPWSLPVHNRSANLAQGSWGEIQSLRRRAKHFFQCADRSKPDTGRACIFIGCLDAGAERNRLNEKADYSTSRQSLSVEAPARKHKHKPALGVTLQRTCVCVCVCLCVCVCVCSTFS